MVAASNLYAAADAFVHLTRSASTGATLAQPQEVVSPTPAGTVSVSLAPPANSAVAASYLLIESNDAYRRSMQTLYKK